MANADQIESRIREKYRVFAPYLNERTRRVWAAVEARVLGYGGVAMVARATGLTRDTVTAGLQELEASDVVPMDRQRKVGGGRSRLIDTDRTLQADLNALINPVTRGDPESSLRWTSKSTSKLATELQAVQPPIIRQASIVHDMSSRFVLMGEFTRRLDCYGRRGASSAHGARIPPGEGGPPECAVPLLRSALGPRPPGNSGRQERSDGPVSGVVSPNNAPP